MVLIPISRGYPIVKGKLHTRYAPVRRSPSICKQIMLPLDLHVLGLPLAFILSQDQTLHSINLLSRGMFHSLFLYISTDPQTLVFLTFISILQRTFKTLSENFLISHPLFRGCKGNTAFLICKCFFEFF